MRIGVLSLQGDFREHLSIIQELGHTPVPIRRAEELIGLDGLIFPGGESTTIVHLAKSFNLFHPIKDAIANGLPVYGSCAGMILLSDRILDGAPGQEGFGGIDMTVRRNAFGRQVQSFEGPVDFAGEQLLGIFIRAPWVESVSQAVTVLSSINEHPVAVRQGKLLATSFHPELTTDHRVHRYFLDEMCS